MIQQEGAYRYKRRLMGEQAVAKCYSYLTENQVRPRPRGKDGWPYSASGRLARGPLVPEASFAAKLLLQREHVTYVLFCVGSLPFLEH